jgi:hypothetical protein
LVIDRLFTCGVRWHSLFGTVSSTLFLPAAFLVLLGVLVLLLVLGSEVLLGI